MGHEEWNSASWEHVNCTVSTGTDPDPLTCMQCMALQTERFHLVGELHQLQDELKDQRKRHAEAQKDYAEVRQQMAKQLRTVDVGVMTVDRPDESEKLEIEEGTQCYLFAPEREELEKEIQRLQRECTEKERLCVALQEENENFKQHRTDTLADEDLGDVVKDDLDKSLVALLMDAGIYNEAIVSTVGNIRYLFQTQPAETCGDDRSTEVEEKLQETQQHLLQEKDAEISNLVEEKNVLAQKVLELRKAAKKEASDKEAAKLETSKLQNDMKEQHSEMEQCRQLVQQKRQQISELEDTLAVMQHENENWERDYEILTRRKDHLERELRIGKNLENTQTTDT